MLELYNSPVSTCSQKVRMTLAEKGISWTDRTIVFARNDHLSDWYLKLNPNGVVPTLVHDGSVITDSSVINEYLDEVPTPSIRYPSFNAYFVPIWSGMSDEEFRAYVERLPLRKHFYLKMGRTGFPQEEIDAALGRLRQTVERMERALEQTSWLAHDMFTLADISIMPSIVRMEDLGLHYLWADLPRVADWYARLRQRPAFATTYFPGTRELGPSC